MRIPYAKPFLDVSGQVDLLLQRGMEITDRSKAIACLERIGYYRLSGYWYPFHQTVNSVDATGREILEVLDAFVPGTRFQDAHDLYVFDKRLRLLFLDAIERVEVGLRVSVALLLGSRSPWAHRDGNYLNSNFINPVMRNGVVVSQSRHTEWLANQDRLANRSSEEFKVAFDSKYDSSLPVWMAIELWDFGLLSKLLAGMKHADLNVLTQDYSFHKREYFTSAARSINHVRNISAHHGRLWNRSLSDSPRLPLTGEIPLLDHVARNHSPAPQSFRLYPTAALLQMLLRKVNPTSTWSSRLAAHMNCFPVNAHTKTSHMGFPDDWKMFPLWQLDASVPELGS